MNAIEIAQMVQNLRSTISEKKEKVTQKIEEYNEKIAEAQKKLNEIESSINSYSGKAKTAAATYVARSQKAIRLEIDKCNTRITDMQKKLEEWVETKTQVAEDWLNNTTTAIQEQSESQLSKQTEAQESVSSA